MARSKRKKAQEPGPDASLFSTEALSEEELPSDHSIQAYSNLKAARRWMKWVIYGALALIPVLLGITFVQLNSINEQQALLEERSHEVEIDSRNKALAQQEVISWLASNPSPMPGAHLLSWDRAVSVVQPSEQTDAAGAQSRIPGVERHELSVLTDSGSRYNAVVQISYDDVLGAAVMGTPTLIPVLPGDDQQLSTALMWPGLESAPQSPAVESAARAWADALFSGDPERLKLIVGDPDAGRGYLPMPTGRISGVRVDAVAAAPDAGKRDSDSDPADALVMRVELSVDYTSVTEEQKRSTQGSTYSYDVLVRAADTAAPRVSAWGGPGTGQDLSDYSNGVQGRLFTTADAQEAAPPSPTPSESSSASPSGSASPTPSSSSSPSPTPDSSSSPSPSSTSTPSPSASASPSPTPSASAPSTSRED